MECFESDGMRIAYAVEGEGSPVLLAHGFASTHAVNWIPTGWVRALVEAGYRVIMPDMRGHGASGKSHDKADYCPLDNSDAADDPVPVALGVRRPS